MTALAASAAKVSRRLTIKRPVLRSDRFKQSLDAEDTHHSLEVIGEHVKAHFNAYPRQSSGQEMGSSHPVFERSKSMSSGFI